MEKVFFSVHVGPKNPNIDDTGNQPYRKGSNVIDNLPPFIPNAFSRISFIYYLLMLVVQVKCAVSLSAWVTVFPIVLSISSSLLCFLTMRRRRKKFVRKINRYTVEVLRNKEWTRIPWGNVEVGDILKLRNGDVAPCDLVLLYTSDGYPASIETSILDGSTQLGPKNIPEIPEMRKEKILTKTKFSINEMHREVYSDPTQAKSTSSSRFEFSGILDFNGKQATLSTKNLIERYSTIFHNGHIIAGAVYTGKNCWTVRHSLFKKKQTHLEKTLNSVNIWMITILLFFSIVMAAFSLLYYPVAKNWPFNDESPMFNYFLHNLRNFMVLLLPLTPLELYSFIDLIYIFNSNVIRHTMKKAYVPNMQCLHDAAHIDTLITSKSMLLDSKPTLKRIFLNGKTYGKDITVRELSTTIENDLMQNITVSRQFYDQSLVPTEDNKLFFLHITLCHAASLVGSKDSFSYISRFPDDEELLQLASKSGFVLVGRTADESTILVGEKRYTFKTKRIIHSSFRHPRISIIVEDCNGTIILFTRGVFKVMTNIIEGIDNYQLNYESFHEDGLHVECCSYKYISQKQYKRFEEKISEFGNENIDFEFSVVENLESHSNFLAMVGFEDQPRDGALLFLARAKRAFNKIVLTSQMKGTSFVITGTSLGIIKNNPIVGTISGNLIEDVEISISYLLETSSYDVIIINGCTIEFLTKSQYTNRVAKIIFDTKTIILQRADSSQAAEFVNYLQNVQHQTVLAVGNTVYDSTYMMEADVSVAGAAGEVRPCTVISDIIVDNFNQLCDIIFIHGNWIRERIDTVINYVMIRNMVFAFLQLWFNIYTGFSGTPLFREAETNLILWFFTFIPLILRSVVNKKYDSDFLLSTPQFYKSKNTENITKKKLLITTAMTCIGALIFLIISKNILEETGTNYGATISLPMFSFELSSIFCVCCIVCLIPQCNTWSFLQHFLIWGSIVFYFGCYLTLAKFESSGQYFNVAVRMFSSRISVLYFIFCVLVAFTVQTFYSYLFKSGVPSSELRQLSSSDNSLLNEISENGEKEDLENFDSVVE